ncbi:pyruvate oxidase [Sediminibacillus massiliensis]|uniref:pyruvate oxidase n=1 Tax=Sediminibacillus massiliensis TaxID=1926277 RepID=UPI0009883D33|nr:pyruvate oxidase [Sediminibacillus massiliensis]
MAVKAGNEAVKVMKSYGINKVFGIPGDSINNIVESLREEKEDIDFIQVRHEEVGALAASAYAKLTGNIGTCLSIGGPGAIHLLNGLYDAKADSVPVLVLAGQVPRDSIGKDSFQEVNLEKMFDDVAVFNKRVDSPESFPGLVQQAIREAYANKGVSVLVIPDDVPTVKIDGTNLGATDTYEPVLTPSEEHLKKTHQYLREAKRPVILAGTGTRHAKEELEQFAEKLAAPIIFALPAKGTLPDQHPYNLGQLGQIGTKPAYEAMEETDLLIMIGTSFPYRDFLPDDTKAVQIDNNPSQIGKRYPVTLGLVGDAKHTLKALANGMDEKEDREFLKACQENMKNWWNHIERDEEPTTPIKPQQVIPNIQKVMEKDAIISVDVGNVTVWAARHLRLTQQKMIVSSWMATMGCGLPGAIAGKLAYPERQVVAICGDGGFSMVMQDFLTAVKYELPIMFVVFNNQRLGMIKYEQQEQGNLDYVTELQDMDYGKFADAAGGKGYRVTSGEDLERVFREASGQTVPVIIDVVLEEQPPLPGKIPIGQAVSYSKYMMKRFFKDYEVDMPPLKNSLKRLL